MITREEYKYLVEYTARHYTRYYDVQLEVIDHLASLIEDIQEKDSTIGFRTALNTAYKSMPGRTFDVVIKEKEKALKKYWERQIGGYLLEYFRWPVIVKTILLTVLVHACLTFFVGYIFVGVGFLFLLCLTAYTVFYLKRLGDNEGQYLSVKAYVTVSYSIWLIPLYASHFIELLDGYLSYTLYAQLGISLCCAMIAFLFYGLLVVFPKKIKEDVLAKYENLIPSIS